LVDALTEDVNEDGYGEDRAAAAEHPEAQPDA
jgi:hypothetical protein